MLFCSSGDMVSSSSLRGSSSCSPELPPPATYPDSLLTSPGRVLLRVRQDRHAPHHWRCRQDDQGVLGDGLEECRSYGVFVPGGVMCLFRCMNGVT
jgi:hypothetical protein